MPEAIKVIGLDALQEHLARSAMATAAAPRVVVQSLARELKNLLLEEAPSKTGALRRGIHYRTVGRGGSWEARFSSDADYTPFVIHGTAAHDIFPGAVRGRFGPGGDHPTESDKRALFWSGAAHPVAFVHHPGTKANDFPARAMERLRRPAGAIMEATGAAIVEGRPVA